MIAQCDISGVAVLQVMLLSFGHKTDALKHRNGFSGLYRINSTVYEFLIIQTQTTAPSHTYIIKFEKYKEGRVLVYY